MQFIPFTHPFHYLAFMQFIRSFRAIMMSCIHVIHSCQHSFHSFVHSLSSFDSFVVANVREIQGKEHASPSTSQKLDMGLVLPCYASTWAPLKAPGQAAATTTKARASGLRSSENFAKCPKLVRKHRLHKTKTLDPAEDLQHCG